MAQFKGTPGPWEIKPEEVDRPYIRIRGTQLGGRFKVANVLSPDYDGVHHREADETRANARLIAAAPELLEALQLMLDSQVLPVWHQSIARAAINKATGETK
ncbi:hypothetical protein [Klebsiella pneumoniae]|uniref:Uncharacterized protein n=1 Tax=Klebsiella phage vB_KpnM_KpV52 TaxID=1912321 RepID=A0A1I9SES3_9CAUD|nr:hypothetical protein [Klebsiella pneumoniae]YP_009597534.1 hypothetical protein FDH17_gp06 [Klebsiella phage vB_KpnM_KpV52]AOZ65350.1 hypothetical protein kpv52_06 [Klebsiella phage vB_KpnM_KpV52]MBE9269768.1 hypothetical protein [Klebsiella pneumoniae]